MNLQTQRLLGQQSLAEFMGLHVYLDRVFNDNLKKNVSAKTSINVIQGPEIIRKNNFIINTGDNLTAKERDQRIKLNKQKYGLPLAEIKGLKIPKTSVVKGGKSGGAGGLVLTIEQIFNAKSNFSVVEKIQHLERLQVALSHKLRIIEKRKLKKKYRPLG